VKYKTLTAFFTVLLLTGMTAAIQPEKAAANNPNFQQGELQQKSFFDSLLSTLSLTSSTDQVQPGGDITFDASVEAQQDIKDISSLVKIVEVYRCEVTQETQDLSVDPCADPNPFIEADRDFISFDASLSEGTSYSWTTTYTTPQEEGTYEAVAYLWDTNTNSIVSETSETRFTVGSPGKPNIEVAGQPSIEFDESTGTVRGTITLENTGDGAMQNNDIVEMQVRPKGEGPLSFLSFLGNQDVCDESYPNNVHRDYRLGPGESVTINLEADQLEKGQSYEVFFLTREACFPDNERVEPIPNSVNAGSFSYAVEQPSDGTGGTDGDDGVGLGVIAAVLGVILIAGYVISRRM